MVDVFSKVREIVSDYQKPPDAPAKPDSSATSSAKTDKPPGKDDDDD